MLSAPASMSGPGVESHNHLHVQEKMGFECVRQGLQSCSHLHLPLDLRGDTRAWGIGLGLAGQVGHGWGFRGGPGRLGWIWTYRAPELRLGVQARSVACRPAQGEGICADLGLTH